MGIIKNSFVNLVKNVFGDGPSKHPINPINEVTINNYIYPYKNTEEIGKIKENKK